MSNDTTPASYARFKLVVRRVTDIIVRSLVQRQQQSGRSTGLAHKLAYQIKEVSAFRVAGYAGNLR
jgi:hypothetical protein